MKINELEFLEVGMRNFLSYGNNMTRIPLAFTNPTLVVGRNYDSIVDGQVDSNGAGKTTILNAIMFCGYDKTLSGISKGDLVNYINGKNLEVYTIFRSGTTYYKVLRYRKNKALGGDGARLYRNEIEPVFTEQHDVTLDSTGNINADIAKIIGMPYEIFSRVVVISAPFEPFLSLPSSSETKANQKDIIEELFGFTELSIKADKLNDELKANRKQLASLLELNQRRTDEITRHSNHLAATEEKVASWDLNQRAKIKAEKAKLVELAGIDIAASQAQITNLEALSTKRDDTKKLLDEYDGKIRQVEIAKRWQVDHLAKIAATKEKISNHERYDVPALKKIRDRINELTANKTQIVAKTKAFNSEISSLLSVEKEKLAELATLNEAICPYCSQHFAETHDKKHACNTTLEETSQSLTLKRDSIKINEIELEKIDEELSILTETSIPNDLDNIEFALGMYRSELEKLEATTNPHPISDEDVVMRRAEIHDDYLAASEAVKLSPQPEYTSKQLMQVELQIETLLTKIDEMKAESNPFISLISGIRETIDQLEKADHEKSNTLDRLIRHQEVLHKFLSKKDSFVRKALLNRNIPYLNKQLEHYLSMIGLEHKVLFTEEMSVKITKFGTECAWEGMSAGQKARINLALSFAFRDVLQKRFSRINFCILDECLDTGLGTVGVHLATKMIKFIAQESKLSMFVISHRDEIASLFDRRLEIELKQGFSTVLGQGVETVDSED